METVEKKSRFIASCIPILGVDSAEAALGQIRLEHKGANHHCYAYRVGIGIPVERFSDDGEPSGTAGRPILEVIRRQQVDNVLIVVTRYFGGVLLGASGLVRAYADAAAQVLDATPRLVCAPMQTITVHCDYGLYGKMEHALAQANLVMRDATFMEDVSFQLVVPEEEVSLRVAELTEWSNGQIQYAVSESEYIGVSGDGSLVRDVWPSVES